MGSEFTCREMGRRLLLRTRPRPNMVPGAVTERGVRKPRLDNSGHGRVPNPRQPSPHGPGPQPFRISICSHPYAFRCNCGHVDYFSGLRVQAQVRSHEKGGNFDALVHLPAGSESTVGGTYIHFHFPAIVLSSTKSPRCSWLYVLDSAQQVALGRLPRRSTCGQRGDANAMPGVAPIGPGRPGATIIQRLSAATSIRSWLATGSFLRIPV